MEDFLAGRSSLARRSESRTSPREEESDAPTIEHDVETIARGPDDPTIEVISVAGRVEKIVITLKDGQVIELACSY